MKSIRILSFLILISLNLYAQEVLPSAERGVLDARNWNFNEKKIALNGYWSFYENELISFSDSLKKTGSISHFPEVWDQTTQYATYELLVLLPANVDSLALEMPQLYCSYELWVNGKKIAENGKVGTTRETSNPQWLPQAVSFNKPDSDSLSVVLQISNFYHFKGGAKEPIYLGQSVMVQHHHDVSVKSSIIESIVLIVLGLSFLVIYYLREERKKVTLYFSLLCITWAIRAMFSNMYASISFYPDFDWGLMVRIEYITLFLTVIWAILFLGGLFPNENSKTIKYLLVGTNCIFIALTIISSPVFFTQWLSVYLGIAGILLLFGLSIVIRAWINERSGVRYLVVCVFLGIAIFSYDIFVYEGFFHYYNAVLFSIGYLVMFLMMGISLLYHLQIFKGDSSSGTLTYEDLYGKNK
jgi:hypothetical protein